MRGSEAKRIAKNGWDVTLGGPVKRHERRFIKAAMKRAESRDEVQRRVDIVVDRRGYR